MEYILFVMQDANFYSKCLLVPKVKFLEVREETYKILLENSQKNVELDGICIENLLIEEYIREGNYGLLKQNNWSSFIESLRTCCEWGSEMCPIEKDENWVRDSIFKLKICFNSVDTYKNNIKLKTNGIVCNMVIVCWN